MSLNFMNFKQNVQAVSQVAANTKYIQANMLILIIGCKILIFLIVIITYDGFVGIGND